MKCIPHGPWNQALIVRSEHYPAIGAIVPIAPAKHDIEQSRNDEEEKKDKRDYP